MMIVTLLVVSICVFLAFNVIPGDPALRMLGTEASPELVEQTRQQMGLNDPLLVRYGRWFVSFIQGDLTTRPRRLWLHISLESITSCWFCWLLPWTRLFPIVFPRVSHLPSFSPLHSASHIFLKQTLEFVTCQF